MSAIPADWARRIAWAATLGTGLAFLILPLTGHRDDSDDQLYRVVARHLVEDGSWLNTRYLPNVHPAFREHLPFGIWPQALALRWGGQAASWVPGLLFSLATLLLVGLLGARLAGNAAGLLACAMLAATESFWVIGGTARLDPPLLFFATLAAAPLLVGRPGLRGWAIALGAGAIATLVKGPFGLLPFAATLLVTSWWRRAPGQFVVGGWVLIAAIVPAVLFLLGDRRFGDGTWWTGYVQGQLVASAVGARADGSARSFAYPFWVVAGRFWPGLPLLLAGVVLALRGRDVRSARLLAVINAVILLGLCLPQRKVWNHTLVAFPMLALLAGLAGATLLKAEGWGTKAWRRVALIASVVMLSAWVAVGAGLGRYLYPPSCVASGVLRPLLRELPSSTPIGVVSDPPSWGTLSSLADELGLVPLMVSSLDESPTPLVLVASRQWRGSILWRKVGEDGSWILVRRVPEIH